MKVANYILQNSTEFSSVHKASSHINPIETPLHLQAKIL
jgi:hypothetical protein